VDASLEERAGWMWGQADGLGTVNHLMQMGFIWCLQGQRSHILLECRESAWWPPALWLGTRFMAAAGRATAV